VEGVQGDDFNVVVFWMHAIRSPMSVSYKTMMGVNLCLIKEECM